MINLTSFIESALKEDVGSGDHSTLSCIDTNKKGKAILHVKESGVLAGVEVARQIFQHLEPDVTFKQNITDGTHIQTGDQVFEVKAHIHTILKAERLVLNTMQRMSGIATLTAQYVEKIKGYNTR
jgi:nicotinate-nucleotide pyrophosphorylase (carboxylating)